MDKAQLLGVQALTVQAADTIFWSIHGIPSQRVANGRHMHPNLMGAPGFKMNFQKRMFVFDFQSFIVSDSRFSVKKVYMPFNN